MHAYQQARSEWRRPSGRQRALAFGLTVLVELVVLLIVLAFGSPRVRDTIAAVSPISITFVPNPSPALRSQQQRRVAPVTPAPRPPVPAPPKPNAPAAATPRPELPFIPMSKVDLAAGDISKFGTAAGAPAGSASAGETSAAVGQGPGGVTLYAAQWVREPTSAELRTYLPNSVPPGAWALIACQTIAHEHVENCAQLGESPRGSGLSRSMRLAAWQFLVRPPRINGKAMVGSWVRIRVDFRNPGEAPDLTGAAE